MLNKIDIIDKIGKWTIVKLPLFPFSRDLRREVPRLGPLTRNKFSGSLSRSVYAGSTRTLSCRGSAGMLGHGGYRPLPWSGRMGRGSGGPTDNFLKCGDTGHMERECPSRKCSCALQPFTPDVEIFRPFAVRLCIDSCKAHLQICEGRRGVGWFVFCHINAVTTMPGFSGL